MSTETPSGKAMYDGRVEKEEYNLEANGAISNLEEEEEPVVTPKTWFVVFILSMGYGLSFWPIPTFAAIGGQVATELGEASKVIWFIPAWTLSITVCFMLAGANTDLLGRRWFLVGGNLICFVGHMVIGTAKGATGVIAGMAITGFGAANCQMAAFALPELLPNKWRHIGVVLADVATFLSVIVAPVSGRFGFEQGTWRWNFYAAAICQFLSFLGLYFYYYPPAHPYGIPFKQMIKELDYVGMFLFIAGALPFLLGIVWTNVYPGKDAHVIAPLVVGFVFLVIFALWETYGKLKHPLTPTYVFVSSRGRDFTAPCIALAVVNMFYYSGSIIWPTMINAFYTNGGIDWQYGILLSIPQGLAISTGAVLLGLFGSKIRRWHWQLTVSVTIMVIFGVLLALGKPSNKGLMIAFVFLSQGAYGWAIYLSIAVSQMGVEHKDLGLSGGLSGTARFAGGSIAAAIFTTVLTNGINTYTAKLVPTAATQAGLPASDVAALLGVVGTPKLAANYPAAVVAAVGGALQEAYRHGIQLVAYTSLAFGIIGIIACLCCKDVDAKMTNKIEVYLDTEKEKAHEIAEKHHHHRDEVAHHTS
ncbi:hypothetical protein B0A49_00394 [Cryomyces minteri]|uniref:Major facilitator superfamily (MFS) profile domain-containing protein n=1 Tax=Cryomyces minteri TaxID=331657 RepID=A0A4V5NI02_9PEZI|nr:hypothetical protein B0A49_00394 [Cryomyces minteri]